MADEVTRTIVDGMGGTGTALGAGNRRIETRNNNSLIF